MSLRYALMLLACCVASGQLKLVAQFSPFAPVVASDDPFPLAPGYLKIVQCGQPALVGLQYTSWLRLAPPSQALDAPSLRSFLGRTSGTNSSQFRFCAVRSSVEIHGAIVDAANETYGFEVIGPHTVRFQGKSNQTWTVTSNFELPLTACSPSTNLVEITPPTTNAITVFRVRAAWREDRRKFHDEQVLRAKALKLLAGGCVKQLPGIDEVNSFHEKFRRLKNDSSMDNFVDGYMVTQGREVFFWELFVGQCLFLLDEHGRSCAIVPK